ncbi:MAG TPA: secretion protein [Burkholderiaceae bacterium]|nr:secretion protein [Burkholderiaceae bacterium]
MKELRVLTGEHAGVRLQLVPQRYIIGADDDADIQLLDWIFDPAVIEVTEDQVVSIAVDSTDLSEGNAGAVALDDFVPKRMNDIVLCVGPADGAWPSDVDLIARLAQPAVVEVQGLSEPAAEAESPGKRRRMKIPFMVGLMAMLAIGGGMALRISQGAQVPVKLAVPLKERVARIVDEQKLSGLEVLSIGDRVEVRGMVPTAAQALALRQRLEALKPGAIQHDYGSAAEVAQNIAEALGMPGVEVNWRGGGIFAVTARTTDVEKLQDAVARIRSDLGSIVTRIDLQAIQEPASNSHPISAALDAGQLKYVQTRDGVKHLSMSEGSYGAGELGQR